MTLQNAPDTLLVSPTARGCSQCSALAREERTSNKALHQSIFLHLPSLFFFTSWVNSEPCRTREVRWRELLWAHACWPMETTAKGAADLLNLKIEYMKQPAKTAHSSGLRRAVHDLFPFGGPLVCCAKSNLSTKALWQRHGHGMGFDAPWRTPRFEALWHLLHGVLCKSSLASECGPRRLGALTP